MSPGSFGKKIYLHPSRESVLYEKIPEKPDDSLGILLEKHTEFVLLESIFQNRVLEYLTERDLPGSIEIRSTECLDRQLLLDSESADAMGDIGSPGHDRIPAQYNIMRVEKVFIDGVKIFL